MRHTEKGSFPPENVSGLGQGCPQQTYCGLEGITVGRELSGDRAWQRGQTAVLAAALVSCWGRRVHSRAKAQHVPSGFPHGLSPSFASILLQGVVQLGSCLLQRISCVHP